MPKPTIDTDAELDAVLATFEMRNFVVPIRWRVLRQFDRQPLVLRDEQVNVEFTLTVRDRDSGLPTTLQLIEKFDLHRYPPDEVFYWFNRTVMEMLTHEFNEAFHIGGVRVNDPHRGE